MCRHYTAASSSICSNLDGPQVINMPWPADIMRAWAGTAGIGPPCSRLLDLRHTLRCITGLSFCLHFAEPKIGSALVTRCCLPPPLSFSVSRSFAPSFSLHRAFAYSVAENDPFGPKSTSAFLSLLITRAGTRLFDARSFSDTVRCTFDPLYFWKIVTPNNLPATDDDDDDVGD